MSLIPSHKLRSPVNNVYLTKGLFQEYGGDVLNLKNVDNPVTGTMSLKAIFIPMVISDPAEVEFAQAVFGEYEHWVKITRAGFIQAYLKAWRKEADTKRKSVAFQTIFKEVEKGKNPLSAAKYLIEEPWKVKAAVKPADKRKARKAISETAEAAFESKELKEDLERLKGRMQ